MYYILSKSVNNSSKAFVLNGLEYQKDVYTVLYSSYEDNNGTPENVYISIVNKSTGAPLISNTKITRFSDGDQFFTSAGQILSYLGGGDDTVPLFVARVETDGGYVEGFQCLINELNAFPDADAGRVIFDAFRVRVVTDAGYAEAKFCTVNEINSLI